MDGERSNSFGRVVMGAAEVESADGRTSNQLRPLDRSRNLLQWAYGSPSWSQEHGYSNCLERGRAACARISEFLRRKLKNSESWIQS